MGSSIMNKLFHLALVSFCLVSADDYDCYPPTLSRAWSYVSNANSASVNAAWFTVESSNKDFEHAAEFCKSLGTGVTLAAIENQAENLAVQKLTTSMITYLGGFKDKNNNWYWTAGGKNQGSGGVEKVGYTNWGNFKPSQSSSTDVIAMRDDGTWTDYGGDWHEKFACQYRC